MVPTLTYVVGLEPKRAIATSLLVVGTTSLLAMTQHARAGKVRFRLGTAFGLAGMAGAYAGGRVAAFVPETFLLFGLATIMALSAIAMLRGRKAPASRSLSLLRGCVVGAAVGLVAGMVGAGGGFLIVPALVFFGGLEIPDAIGTSLFVVTMQSLAGVVGHLSHTTVDVRLVTVVGGCAILGSFVGAVLSRRIAADRLRVAFACLVAAVAVVTIVKEVLTTRASSALPPRAPRAAEERARSARSRSREPPVQPALDRARPASLGLPSAVC